MLKIYSDVQNVLYLLLSLAKKIYYGRNSLSDSFISDQGSLVIMGWPVTDCLLGDVV